MSTPVPTRDPLVRQVAKTRVVLWTCALVVLGAISVRWWPMGDSPVKLAQGLEFVESSSSNPEL